MAVKTFEQEVKKLTGEFKNLIENYNFEEYDFHSIRQTLQDYIEQTYPNYNDYFRSDYVMMLIELFAFYGEMMAYRVDMNLNEAYLSTAKDRRSVIKIADMLGYKYSRIMPAMAILKVDMSDQPQGASFISKKKEQGSLNDILSKSSQIKFSPIPMDGNSYFPYKLDYLLKRITAEDFLNTVENIFTRLEDFSDVLNIKSKSITENNFEYYERSIFVDKFQMRFNPNENLYVDYIGNRKMFEIQSLSYDEYLYHNTYNTLDALTYNDDTLYSDVVELGFEFVLKYDKGQNILDKNVFMYMPVIQGGSFTREIDPGKGVRNFSDIAYEKNIFNNKTMVKQYDAIGNLIRTYYEVDNLNNSSQRYAYETNNTPEGFVELIFGDGKNAEILLPAALTLLYYRKNASNTDELFNVKNAVFSSVPVSVQYYDSHVGQTQTVTLQIQSVEDAFNASGGQPAESNEQIKYMARKLRSVQDRFVTGKDYETAGMLHPRVRFCTVILRSYIGRNSSRMSNEYLDVYFDAIKNNIKSHIITENNGTIVTYISVSSAYFTDSSVTGKFDSIKFVETGEEYFFEIFDMDSITPNEWYKYPIEMMESKSKGTCIRLLNKIVVGDFQTKLVDATKLNNILPLEYMIESVEFQANEKFILIFKIFAPQIKDKKAAMLNMEEKKLSILEKFNTLSTEFKITDVTYEEQPDGYIMYLRYATLTFPIPSSDFSFIWTHYKSDDIFINPSKSNIVEIYVTAVRKDLKKGISIYEPLTSSEINKLVADINKRKMISDMVNVYNSSIFEVIVAVNVFKNKNMNLTDELLKSKINTVLDLFFDVENLPLGAHFYMSKLIEWLHSNIPEIQHIELILDDNKQPITPTSTIEFLGEKITYTQIVEKTRILNGVRTPQRQIVIM